MSTMDSGQAGRDMGSHTRLRPCLDCVRRPVFPHNAMWLEVCLLLYRPRRPCPTSSHIPTYLVCRYHPCMYSLYLYGRASTIDQSAGRVAVYRGFHRGSPTRYLPPPLEVPYAKVPCAHPRPAWLAGLPGPYGFNIRRARSGMYVIPTCLCSKAHPLSTGSVLDARGRTWSGRVVQVVQGSLASSQFPKWISIHD